MNLSRGVLLTRSWFLHTALYLLTPSTGVEFLCRLLIISTHIINCLKAWVASWKLLYLLEQQVILRVSGLWLSTTVFLWFQQVLGSWAELVHQLTSNCALLPRFIKCPLLDFNHSFSILKAAFLLAATQNREREREILSSSATTKLNWTAFPEPTPVTFEHFRIIKKRKDMRQQGGYI